ncbi:hypothetical protein C8A05DRAFT_36302 [Staphylotrichum tortipilum]|uniref:Uncharacterized protein n=1 Tax=Staphylotrichum tortipilum TaxID=2831512 RepID=A0AAN6MFS2_9PEZI|nr:hypothetical protein C8A05DRAFT_36302 [Staphylotrichum longicolle]
MDTKEYKKALDEDAMIEPWWMGKLTTLNGHYFTENGGNYCFKDELGLTAAIVPFKQDANGRPKATAQYQTANYRDANNLLAAGTNLKCAVPKSATLLHELFHAIHGKALLSGDIEKYK